MRLQHFLLSILAVAIVTSIAVAVNQSRKNAILIPTLDLGQAQLGGSLLGDLLNGVNVYQYSDTASANGVVLYQDMHNLPRCAAGSTTAASVVGSNAPPTSTRFWGYEYSGNETANKTAGKTGRELFDGKFFISPGEFAAFANDTARTQLYNQLNTMTFISSGKSYYFMTAVDLSFKCNAGVQVASVVTGSSSSSISSSTAFSQSSGSGSVSSGQTSSGAASSGGASSDQNSSGDASSSTGGGAGGSSSDGGTSSDATSSIGDSSSVNNASSSTGGGSSDAGSSVGGASSSAGNTSSTAQSSSIVMASSSLTQIEFRATLEGSQEVPTVNSVSEGTGVFFLTPATGVFTYYIQEDIDDAGGVETAAHIHGPAARGTPAGVLFTLPTTAIKSGTLTLDSAQMTQLLQDQWYVNVHTSDHTDGELRGQIERYPFSSSSIAVSSTSSVVSSVALSSSVPASSVAASSIAASSTPASSSLAASSTAGACVLCADFNADTYINSQDDQFVFDHLNTCTGQANFDARYDINQDGCITNADRSCVYNAPVKTNVLCQACVKCMDLDGDTNVTGFDTNMTTNMTYGACTGNQNFVPSLDINDDGCLTQADSLCMTNAQGTGPLSCYVSAACSSCLDVTANGTVDVNDVYDVQYYLWQCRGGWGYEAKYDINNDGCILEDDVTCVENGIGATNVTCAFSSSSQSSSLITGSSSVSSELSSSSSSVMVAVCGNGILEQGEECDDNNTTDNDGCFSNCALMIPPASFPVVSSPFRNFVAQIMSFLSAIF